MEKESLELGTLKVMEYQTQDNTSQGLGGQGMFMGSLGSCHTLAWEYSATQSLQGGHCPCAWIPEP